MEEETQFLRFLDLINAVANAEMKFKIYKLEYEQCHNNMLLNSNWDEINEERQKQGLPKLGNQDMKNAFVENKLIHMKKDLSLYERGYLDLKRKYDVALKYSFETLKVSL